MNLLDLYENAQLKTVAEGAGVGWQADYEDEYDHDNELNSGDYVRDTQDCSGEVFVMIGDPSERRVRIEDRDRRGWYIQAQRLVRVADDDPAIARYFGDEDLDEVDKSSLGPYLHAASSDAANWKNDVAARKKAGKTQPGTSGIAYAEKMLKKREAGVNSAVSRLNKEAGHEYSSAADDAFLNNDQIALKAARARARMNESESHAEMAMMAHQAYIEAVRAGNPVMAREYMKQYLAHKEYSKPMPKLKTSEPDIIEAKGLQKKVKIVKGQDAGKIGWIREIKHGAFKGAAKTYYVDLEDGGQANNLPGTSLRLVKDQDVVEDDSAMQAYLAKGGSVQQLPFKNPRTSDKTNYGSKHIGTGRGGKAQNVSGKRANTRVGAKPVVAVEGHVGPTHKDWAASVERVKQSKFKTNDLWNSAQNVPYHHLAQLARDSGLTPSDEMLKHEQKRKAKSVTETGRFTVNANTGAKLDPRTGRTLPSKPQAIRRPAAPKQNISALLDKIWQKVEQVVGQIYPDGDPIDYIGPWAEKNGIPYEMVNRAVQKRGGFKDMYAYWDSFAKEHGKDLGESEELDEAGKWIGFLVRTLA